MELSRHKNHRNLNYLNWLRQQNCLVSVKKAQCAHHVRLGTNGGVALKPSDYFCIPLTDLHHTLGEQAVHRLGEDSFIRHWRLNLLSIFEKQLGDYLFLKHDIKIKLGNLSQLLKIELLIIEIESRETKKPVKKIKISITESEFYQKQKKLKKKSDKKLREKIKEDEKISSKMGNQKINKLPSVTESRFYQDAKEKRKKMEKKIRDELKLKNSEYRKERYRRQKDYLANGNKN